MKINEIFIEKVHVNLGNLVLEVYIGKFPEVADENIYREPLALPWAIKLIKHCYLYVSNHFWKCTW